MRQISKWTLLILYYSSIILLTYKAFPLNYEHLPLPFVFGIPVLLLISLVFFVSEDRHLVIFSPILHKKIKHKSGDYYVKYDKDSEKYILYKDKIFYKIKIYYFNDACIKNSEDILKEVKKKLDTKYEREIQLIEKEKMLYDWDGYTSIEEKRDDKITKVLD